MLAFDIYEHPDHVHHGAIAAAFVVETSMAALPWSNAHWLSGQ
jgi:hypothetical protein